MRKILIIFIVSISCIGTMIYITGAIDFIPKLRVLAQSPDGEFTVKVYQKRLSPRPFFARMGAVAKVYDKRGNLVYENLIFSDDDWDDSVGNSFNQISFDNGEIQISPGAWEKTYVIKKSDFKIQE